MARDTSTADSPRITEKEFLEQVRELARMLGWEFYHPWLSRFSPRGFPDLVLVRPPRLLFVELKSDTGRVTDDQKRWLHLLRDCGVEAYVWRPAYWGEIVRILTQREDVSAGSR